MHVLVLHLFMAAALLPAAGRAQAISLPIDSTPLVRPQHLVRLRARNPETLLARIRRMVTRSGFAVVDRDDDTFFFAAQRNDSSPSKDYDKILVWFERDAREPTRYVGVHVRYGRFEEVWAAAGRDVYRVRVDSAFETRHIGTIKQAIVALADSL